MISSPSFARLAARLQQSGFVPEPWFDGAPRFSEEPLRLTTDERDVLYRAAEEVTAAFQALCELCSERLELVDDELGLSPAQRLMWSASLPLWHGMARADAFVTDEGVQVCELNCDTPTGQPEAVVSSALALDDWSAAGVVRHDQRDTSLDDPNVALGARIVRMVSDLLAAQARPTHLRSVGIVYPTELTEDLGMISLLQRWLEAAGFRVTIGSPFNLTDGGPSGVRLFDEPCDVIYRHYKTDWWGEREPVWADAEPIPDDRPLARPLALLLRGVVEGRLTVVNPFGAVVPQNKRSLALLWEHLDELPAEARRAVRRYLPPTHRLERLPTAQLLDERERWVLKSDYGCEGEEVVIGAECPPEDWAAALRQARPRRWVAQRRFEPRRDERGCAMNHGVYVIAGAACGLLCRAQVGATDCAALVVPVLVEAS
jgi:glutathionylspermidine synthase